jgi:hypothetical protein
MREGAIHSLPAFVRARRAAWRRSLRSPLWSPP